MSTHDKVIQVLQKVTGKPVFPGGEESLFDSGLLDSFALPDLIGALENEFAIKVPDSDLTPRKFETVDRIVEYVDGKM